MISRNDKIFVAGHRGMVGSAVVRALRAQGYENLVTRTHAELDLCSEPAVAAFFAEERPDAVVVAAARVGGIKANMEHPAEFLYENLMIQNNVIHYAHTTGVRRLCFLGSSCVYPRLCPQPMKEEYLLSGPLEPTNEGYAIAKIAGLRMVEFYHRQYGLSWISVMPCNLYGTNDCFDLDRSHVLSALVKKFVDAVDETASSVEIWGTGTALREFLHVDDAAEGICLALEKYDGETFINLGSGNEITIRDLVAMVRGASGFRGEVRWDSSKPDGMPRKCMDSSRMRGLGWAPKIALYDGITRMINEYRALKKVTSGGAG